MTAIKKIKIPKSVKIIDDRVFLGCKNLSEMVFKGDTSEMTIGLFLVDNYSSVRIVDESSIIQRK